MTLSADLSGYSADEKQMLAKLIGAAKIMDDIYWQQTYGDKDELLSGIRDSDTHRFAEINYGPWDRFERRSALRGRHRQETPGCELLSVGDEQG